MDQNSIWNWPNFTILWLSRTFLFFFSKLAVKLPRLQPNPFFYSGKTFLADQKTNEKLTGQFFGQRGWPKPHGRALYQIAEQFLHLQMAIFFPISSFAKVEKKVLVLVSKWYLSSGRFTKCFSKQASGLVPCNEAIFLTWFCLGWVCLASRPYWKVGWNNLRDSPLKRVFAIYPFLERPYKD